jgi:glycosyltransferase involved in cell wall biosynthesis
VVRKAKPWLVFAPHLRWPPRNGADVLIDGRWGAFSRFVGFVEIVGAEQVCRYEGGSLSGCYGYQNKPRGRFRASLAVLMKGSHYLVERHVTPAARTMMRRLLTQNDYGGVVFSYIASASGVDSAALGANRMMCVETHNDEFKWFEDLGRRTRNPLVKLVAWQSRRWLGRFLPDQGRGLVYVHVSDQDQAAYEGRLPGSRGFVVPVGVRLPDGQGGGAALALSPSGELRLLFVGSLSVGMNLDALRNFARRFFLPIKQELGPELRMQVAGSRPSKAVKELCRNNQWELYPDVSEEELSKLLRQAAFTVLPFEYATGGKLKLLQSLAFGVPVLATSVVRDQLERLPSPCVFSDRPEAWLAAVRDVREHGISADKREALVGIADGYSWERTSELLCNKLLGSECDIPGRAVI